MHPILASPRRLAVYLLAWAPVLALLVFVTWRSGAANWQHVAASLAPACMIYAFICLSPFYICRARPLGRSNAASLLATFIGAATAAGLVFTWVAWQTGYSLSQTRAIQGNARTLQPYLPFWFGMSALLYLLSAGLHYAVLAAEASREAERRAAEARTLAREAELQALRMQVNPHFLFNSLHSISALVTQDAARAREMCVRLAAFLRSSLKLGDRECIPLREELALAESYLAVEQIRFGARLRVEEEIQDGCETCAIPALLLQPLVENAVKHGIAGLIEGGAIRLAVKRTGASVSIILENPFAAESPAPGLGLGLKQARRRLQIRYGDDAQFQAGPAGGIYRVILRFPCASPMAESNRA